MTKLLKQSLVKARVQDVPFPDLGKGEDYSGYKDFLLNKGLTHSKESLTFYFEEKRRYRGEGYWQDMVPYLINLGYNIHPGSSAPISMYIANVWDKEVHLKFHANTYYTGVPPRYIAGLEPSGGQVMTHLSTNEEGVDLDTSIEGTAYHEVYFRNDIYLDVTLEKDCALRLVLRNGLRLINAYIFTDLDINA